MRALAACVVALAVVAAAAAAPPQRALVVPGKSLGGLRLGMAKAQITARWGSSYGVCRDCRALTWYFNYKPFTQEGVAVEFRRGRVSALWTIWSPAGWHTNRGLLVGDPQARVTALYGTLVTSVCSGYSALMLPNHSVVTSFYVVDGKVWGFGLSPPGVRACH